MTMWVKRTSSGMHSLVCFFGRSTLILSLLSQWVFRNCLDCLRFVIDQSVFLLQQIRGAVKEQKERRILTRLACRLTGSFGREIKTKKIIIIKWTLGLKCHLKKTFTLPIDFPSWHSYPLSHNWTFLLNFFLKNKNNFRTIKKKVKNDISV